MHASKLIRFLAVFEPAEIQAFGQFLDSPFAYIGKRPLKVQSLLRHLLFFYPDFETEELNEIDVFQSVFPEEKFNKNKLDKLASEAVSVIRKFIAMNHSGNNEINEWLNQIQFFQHKGLETDFFYVFKKAQKLLRTTLYQEQEYFYYQFLLEKEKIKYLTKINDKKSDINLPIAIKNLDLYYIISKMEFCSYLLTQSNSINIDTSKSMTLLKEVLEVSKNCYLDIPIVAAYYYSFSLLLHKNDNSKEDFMHLKRVLQENYQLISKNVITVFHSYMRNYLATRYIEGDVSCLSELFELFKEQIKQKTIYQDGVHILASTLQSAITVAVRLKEHSWAMDFLIHHEDRIKGADDPKAIFQFNLANIYFHQGKYQEAQDCLEHFHFREMFYNLAARRLGIKLDYETQLPLDVFEYRLKALKSFVYEQKKILPRDKFDSNNNFVKLLMQVFTILQEDYSRSFMNLEPKADRAIRIRELDKKVKTEKTIAEREWVLEKLEELKS